MHKRKGIDLIRMLRSKRIVNKNVKPEVGFLEVTSHCNFKCTFCPSEFLKRKKCNLDLERGKKFIKQLYENYGEVPLQLNVLGEPLINKDLFEYFDLCKQYNIRIILITNSLG